MKVAMRTVTRRYTLGTLLIAQVAVALLPGLHRTKIDTAEYHPVYRQGGRTLRHWRAVYRACLFWQGSKALMANGMEARRYPRSSRARIRKRLLAYGTLRSVLPDMHSSLKF